MKQREDREGERGRERKKKTDLGQTHEVIENLTS